MSGTMRTHRMNATNKIRYVDEAVALATNEVYTYSEEEVNRINAIMNLHNCSFADAITFMRRDMYFAAPRGKYEELSMERPGLINKILSARKVSVEDELMMLVESEEVLQMAKGEV